MDRLKLVFKMWLIATIAHVTLSGFVLEGVGAYRLPVSPEKPLVTFQLATDMPPIVSKEDFLDGRYADLEDDAFWVAVVKESMARWNEIPGSYLRLELSTTRGGQLNDSDGMFSIVTTPNLPSTVGAQARPIPDLKTKKITDCDVELRTSAYSGRFAGTAIMHELGHCIGLGHNHIDNQATMSYARVDENLSLGLDDMAAVIYLYGSPETSGKKSEFTPCGVVGNVTSAGSHLFALLFLLAPLLVCFLVRQKLSAQGLKFRCTKLR